MSTLVPLSAALKVEQPETRLNNRISGHLGSLTPGGAAKIVSAWSSRLPRALAIGLGLAAADEDCAARLRAAQIEAIVRLTPLAMGASCLNVVVLMLTLGSVGPIGWPLWVWSACSSHWCSGTAAVGGRVGIASEAARYHLRRFGGR